MAHHRSSTASLPGSALIVVPGPLAQEGCHCEPSPEPAHQNLHRLMGTLDRLRREAVAGTCPLTRK